MSAQSPAPNVLEHSAPIVFDEADLALFSKASHDVNPLHLDANYAHATSYAQRAVFGVLGVLSLLGRRTSNESNARATRVRAEFPNPIFIGIAYRAEILRDDAAQYSVRLIDGKRRVAKLSIEYAQAGASISHPGASPQASPPASQSAPRISAARFTADTLDAESGTAAAGDWACDPDALRALESRWNLHAGGLSDVQLAALIWTSYCIGMELPGEAALFSQLDLRFETAATHVPTSFEFNARAPRIDRRYNLLSVEVGLGGEPSPFARGKLQAFVRDAPTRIAPAESQPSIQSFAGQSALVLGGSRGLGAEIAAHLARRGADVGVVYRKSGASFATLAQTVTSDIAAARGKGALRGLEGDAASEAWAASAGAHFTRESRTIDLLVINANPPLLSQWFEPESAQRIHDYLEAALALVYVPLCHFLPLMNPAHGRIVLISSTAIEAPPGEWPHYVAGKCAAEGMIQTAAREYSALEFWIVRPPRLLTDLTNTPMGRAGALAPATIAAALADALASDRVPGKVHLLREFTGAPYH